ncbi:uncharacterized protein LOC144142350 isoform X2 [Haemaphysalis longicornis]
MPMCCAFGCPTKDGIGKRLFLIPSGKRDAQRRKVWVHRIGRADFKPTLQSRLCEDHFTEDQFEPQILKKLGVKKLKPNATPSIFSHRKPPKPRKPPARRDVPPCSEACSQGPQASKESFAAVETVCRIVVVPAEEGCIPEPKNTTQNEACKASRSQGTQTTDSVYKASRSQRTQATVSAFKKGAEVGRAQKDAPLEPASSLAGVHSSLAWDPGREQPGNGILRAALQRSVVAPEMGSIPARGAHCLEAREGSRARRPPGDSTTTQVQVQPGVGHESTLPTADPQAQAIVWPYPCTICQQTFGRLADLRSHVWAHSSVQCFTCALCQESFGTPHGLAEHEKWHACGEPCSCSLCPRVFMDKAKMVQHQRMHAGEKPFVCGVCGKGFACRPYLVSHCRYMHSDERPHVCAVCGKRFVHKSHLASHAKAHGREMPHECRTCHQRFPYKFHLVSHEMSHAGQELQCEGEPGNTACP